MKQYKQAVSEGLVEITMTHDTLDNGSAVINFDMWGNEDDQVIAQAGYVMTRKDMEDECFYVTVFNADGDVLSETQVPMVFSGDYCMGAVK